MPENPKPPHLFPCYLDSLSWFNEILVPNDEGDNVRVDIALGDPLISTAVLIDIVVASLVAQPVDSLGGWFIDPTELLPFVKTLQQSAQSRDPRVRVRTQTQIKDAMQCTLTQRFPQHFGRHSIDGFELRENLQQLCGPAVDKIRDIRLKGWYPTNRQANALSAWKNGLVWTANCMMKTAFHSIRKKKAPYDGPRCRVPATVKFCERYAE